MSELTLVYVRLYDNMDPLSHKFYSYAEAWERIKRALEQGFYFEAVTIQESILSAKLRAILFAHGVLDRATEQKRSATFNDLIKRWRNLNLENVSHSEHSDLIAEVDRWRSQRNHIVHGIVRSRENTEIANIDDFIELARRTAVEGRDLAKAVEYWSRRHLRALKKASEK